MVSILGDYNYTFPKPIPLKLKLKDMLEDNVDEKYFLSDKQINDIQPFGTYYTWKDKQGNINTQCNRAADENRNALTVACANTGNVLTNYRIRKLTPKECGRLMNVKDEDIDKLQLSDSAMFHIFGDSICTNVLMAIFGELLDIDWKTKLEEMLNGNI